MHNLAYDNHAYSSTIMTQNEAAGGGDGGESTLSLFTSILHKQEQEYISSSSSPSSSKEDGSSGKIKLFDLATRLIVLNLSHDNEGQNGVKIWTIILQFMQRHPDYAISNLKPEHYSTPLLQNKNKKTTTRQDGHRDDGDGREEEQEVDEDRDEEKMVYWLIPRLLRCIIVQASMTTSSTTASSSAPSKATRSSASSPSRSVNIDGRSNTSHKVQVQQEQEGQQEDNTVLHQGEKWICDVITHCLRVWFHRDEGGMQRRRELVHALIKLAQGAFNVTARTSHRAYFWNYEADTFLFSSCP